MARRWKALLIQDIIDYASIILPIIQHYIRYVQPECYIRSPEAVLEWIIREEIERTYYLFDTRHQRHLYPYSAIAQYVKGQVPYDFSVLTGQYIKVPLLYGDNMHVEIWVKGRDLYISYNK